VVCVGACRIYIVHGVQSIMMKETVVQHVNIHYKFVVGGLDR